MKNSVKRKNKLRIIVAIFFVAVMLIAEMLAPNISQAVDNGEWVSAMISRFCGGAVCLLLISSFFSSKFFAFDLSPKKLLIFIPCMLIAINNFPFVTVLSGEAHVGKDPVKILLYALLCISVGFFEEMAFRGCIFSFVLQRRGNKVVDVFWSIVISSAIFGGVHIVNMFMGADPGATLLQIGYSFLIGGMCSIMLVKTHNIWLCVILHAVYNFAGGVVPNCGDGIIWTLPEIILTAVVAVGVAIYVIYTLLKIQPHEVDGVFKKDIGE